MPSTTTDIIVIDKTSTMVSDFQEYINMWTDYVNI